MNLVAYHVIKTSFCNSGGLMYGPLYEWPFHTTRLDAFCDITCISPLHQCTCSLFRMVGDALLGRPLQLFRNTGRSAYTIIEGPLLKHYKKGHRNNYNVATIIWRPQVLSATKSIRVCYYEVTPSTGSHPIGDLTKNRVLPIALRAIGRTFNRNIIL